MQGKGVGGEGGVGSDCEDVYSIKREKCGIFVPS